MATLTDVTATPPHKSAGSNGQMDQATLMSLQSAGLADDIVFGDDGFAVFWPTENRGAFAAHDLRAIADHLDAMNAEWAAQIEADLGSAA